MKIVITTLIWKRPEIFDIWLDAVDVIREKHDIEVVVCGSEGEKTENYCKSRGCHYIEWDNSPLGMKANKRLLYIKEMYPDYVIFLGSDDIMSLKTFEDYLKLAEKGLDIVAPLTLYIYDRPTDRFIYSRGYENHRRGEPLAVGRMLSKRVLDKCGWQLWANMAHRGLDAYARNKINKTGGWKCQYFKLEETNRFIMDIKSQTNMAKFQKRTNHEWRQTEILSKHFPSELVKKITNGRYI